MIATNPPCRYFFVIDGMIVNGSLYGDDCYPTGNYNRVITGKDETQWIEVKRKKTTRVRLREKFMDKFVGRYSFASELVTEFVNIERITCRAVFDEKWSSP